MSGIERIAAERRRQLDELGWTPEHDDDAHDDEDLTWAAVCYAAPYSVYMLGEPGCPGDFHFLDPWPWGEASDKRPRDALGELIVVNDEQRIRNLEKAGALIAAAIDWLLRRRDERMQSDSEGGDAA